ncbi:putative membrane protein [Mycobacteroides abscessus subsp. massiliense CCUG 48898 = JCM 15300]|nr:putative membrane protein [Mycobacteroides abscessus subsp. massiliense CCUG 48898 = JCM 15300]BAP96673.1 hypothetical protein MMASJCM_1897 [Mycobacteroides abscessus subsp. massiliense CCUG 48898 = JCM 15300]
MGCWFGALFAVLFVGGLFAMLLFAGLLFAMLLAVCGDA